MDGEVNELFQPRRTRWLAAAGIASLLCAFLLLLTPGAYVTTDNVGADGYSKSAIGHLGLMRLLKAEGESVRQARVALRDRDLGLLVLCEPRQVRADDDASVMAMIERAPATLVVLPKRTGEPDPDRPGWLREPQLLAERDVTAVLDAIGRWVDEPAPKLLRTEAPERWRKPGAWPQPTIAGGVQLLEKGGVEPWVHDEQGVLLGRVGELWVLSDPDVLANFGLSQGDNAAFVRQLLRIARRDGGGRGAIVFDETLHGHRLDPSLWHLAGRFPFVLLPAQALLVLGILLWIANGRFGIVRREAVGIAAGKSFLLDNAAALLQATGGATTSLRAYARQRLRALAARLQAPRGLGDDDTRSFVLARVDDADGELQRALQAAPGSRGAAEALRLAQRLHDLTEPHQHVHR